jgi:translation initiation factor 2-alpha kinase 4
MGKPSAKENQSARPTDGNAQAQEDELEVLKAIYMEDFAETEAKGAWSVCMQLVSCIKSPLH